VIAYMVRKTTHAHSPSSPEAVEDAVRKARAEKGVELILVVYDKDATHLYVQKERRRGKSAANPVRTASAR
jgi:hypothetical protein